MHLLVGRDGMNGERDLVSATQVEKRLCDLIDSAVKIVDDETEAIRQYGAKDLDKFIERKGQVLVNLDRQMKSAGRLRHEGALADRLKILRDALERNSRYLQINIDAVSEVSQMIVRSIEAARSDGTYAQSRLWNDRS